MRNIVVLIVFAILFCQAIDGKSQHVIASAGGYFEGQNIQMSWTVGEPITETFTGADLILTQGFQQPFNFYLTQLLNVPVGWSGVSSFVEPINKGVEEIFSPYQNNFIILASLTEVYYPAGNMNTIGDWSAETGYQIKAYNDFSFTMTGSKISDPTVDLTMGWNLMPVPVSCGTAVDDLFGSSDVLMAKEVAGVGVYWPEYGIATLSEVAPGKAYWVAMSSSQSITYPECSAKKYSPQSPTQPKNNSPWNDLHFTALSHPIAFPAGVLADLDIQPGDIIGVFTPEGLCAGLTEISSISAGTAVMAFANDETTPEKDGFATGEMFQFKLYSYQQNEEYDFFVQYNQSLPNTSQFQIQGISAVTSVTMIPTSIGNIDNFASGVFPNPSDGNLSLAMSRWPANLQIQLLDSRGSILETYLPGAKLNGSTLLFNLEHLPGGVYFLKLIDSGQVEIKKLIIH
jgi:hypothetical protein